MPPKGATKATAVAKATAVKKTAVKEKEDPVRMQGLRVQSARRKRIQSARRRCIQSELCKKTGTALGIHGIKLHIAKPG